MRYPGDKGGAGVYQTIIDNIPAHDIYIEMHLGGGSILERKKPAVRNLLLRLRHRYLTLPDEPQALHRVLAALAPPLAIELSALLQAGGMSCP